jgi:FMN-binding protein
VRRLAVCLALAAVAFPSADAWAAARRAAKPKVTVQHASFLGAEVHVGPFGDVLVRINVTKTTIANGKHVTVRRRISSIRVPVWTNHTARSVFLTQGALPKLIPEAIDAQSAKIQYVAGATLTSNGFMESLQAAILKSQRW